ncbi:tetratricopeptide repeat protein [Lysinibacillus sp. NPDC097195]|uniref:tetratricopeptide repeat protein n=1 Tax=Lysinibacillus sp. NPDC097195 TaxID=3364141 RepID=UPI00382F95E1
MVIKHFEEQVQQVNELFVSGQVKESYMLAKALLGNESFTANESFAMIQQHVALLEANGYANMPIPTASNVKQSVERADGSYPERDVLAAYIGSQDDEQFGQVVDELLAGSIEAQANAYYTMAEYFVLSEELDKAMVQYAEAIKLQPNTALYWGAFAQFINRIEASPYLALRLIEEAIQLDSMNPRWHYIQGNILFQLVAATKNLSYIPALEEAWQKAKKRCAAKQLALKVEIAKSEDLLAQWKKQML